MCRVGFGPPFSFAPRAFTSTPTRVSLGLEVDVFATLELGRTSTLFYTSGMSTIAELENAVTQLSREDLQTFRDWFLEFDAVAWDAQFAEDVRAGRLDALADEALVDLRAGRVSDL
jgi:hypothetical protein